MNKLSKDQLRDYIASEIKRINAWDDVPESQKAPRRVYVTSVQKFADGHFDELMASRTHICVPEDFFHKLPHLRGSSLAANLYSPITGLNIEAMKKLTRAEARDLINALKNEA